ncbi:hypothetical protein GCM10010232_17870 [Streptomyces amakusaensis]|uniref:GNAT family N-acetyltransferase n=1 Tax=Streptomyces amakusaensis TaxID=67271 RepID=A0ABW0AQT4_9ACTN
MSFISTAEAVQAWVHGWAASRNAAEPASRPWGFTIDVGLPGHVARHVVHSGDEAAVREITESAAGPGVWLKACMPPGTFAPLLAPGWSLTAGPDFLMTAPLSAAPSRAPAEPPGGYRLRTWTRAGVTRALVRTSDGGYAARGQIAVSGDSAVADQVETDPAHQRRGLGRLVMRTLTEAAAEQGATTGVLVATAEGRALYETSGWHVLTPVASAVRDPDPVGV